MTSLTQMATDRRRWRLRAEFTAFFVVMPVLIAVSLPPERMFAALFAFTALGVGLLHVTPNFSWRDLFSGLIRLDWRFIGIFTLVTLATASTVVLAFEPAAFLNLARTQPGLLVMILCLYPLFSALPQEVVFRPLFFRRYGDILPDGLWGRLALNAVLFSWAHLMYWNWIVLAMTFFGGLAFAYAYEARRNFPEAVILHAISGNIVFALGLGLYFYSGNVARPF
jgi:membrane protease YdiL (CAAX protease family)